MEVLQESLLISVNLGHGGLIFLDIKILGSLEFVITVLVSLFLFILILLSRLQVVQMLLYHSHFVFVMFALDLSLLLFNFVQFSLAFKLLLLHISQ